MTLECRRLGAHLLERLRVGEVRELGSVPLARVFGRVGSALGLLGFVLALEELVVLDDDERRLVPHDLAGVPRALVPLVGLLRLDAHAHRPQFPQLRGRDLRVFRWRGAGCALRGRAALHGLIRAIRARGHDRRDIRSDKLPRRVLSHARRVHDHREHRHRVLHVVA